MTKESRILISASLFHALNDSATVVVPMIFPLLYSQQFLIHTYAQMGILSNLGLLTTFLFQILVVQASMKVGYKPLLVVSFVGISITLILISMASGYWILLLLYLLFRVFDSFYHTLGLAWVSRSHPSEGIDFAMGVQSGSGNFGVFLAFISTGYLAQTFGWVLPVQSWAAACFLLGLASYLLIRKISFSTGEEDGRATGSPSRFTWASWGQTLKRVRPYVLGFIFGGASWGTTVYFAPSLLHHKFHISMGKTGVLMALWIGLGTVMTYLFGSLSRAWGRLRVYRAGFGGATFGLLLLGFSPVPGFALAGLFLFGTFLFLIYPALQSYVGNAVPSRNQAQAFSIVSNIQMVSGAAASLAAGFLSDAFGISSPFFLLGFFGGVATVSSSLPRPAASETRA